MSQSTPNLQTLAGKVAIVSGSSSGIGAAIARELSRRGASVVINYPYPNLKSAAVSVQQSLQSRGTSITVEADISTRGGPKHLVQSAVDTFGKIDILVNNAGISNLLALDDPDDEKFEKTWETVVGVNGRGTLMLTREALKHLSPTHSRIVNIGSSTSHHPDADMSIYAGTKGMVESFTRCWARDLPRKYGCTVNAIAPGPVATEAMKAAPPEFLKMLEDKSSSTPVALRMASPEEIAWAVATLCEEKAGWINGVLLPVTGGSPLM